MFEIVKDEVSADRLGRNSHKNSHHQEKTHTGRIKQDRTKYKKQKAGSAVISRVCGFTINENTTRKITIKKR